MYRTIQQSLLARIQAILLAKYDITLTQLAVEQPPSIALGELALARRLRAGQAPPQSPPRHRDRTRCGTHRCCSPSSKASPLSKSPAPATSTSASTAPPPSAALPQTSHADIGGPGFCLIEHTSINPNKAAHIGHLRNAILGDTFQRLLRPDGYKTGVPGRRAELHRQHRRAGRRRRRRPRPSRRQDSRDHPRTPRRARRRRHAHRLLLLGPLRPRLQWYTGRLHDLSSPRRKQIRLDTLHALETGGNDTAAIADLISTAVLHRHLETMQRLGIEYDFLPRESEILSASTSGTQPARS